MDYRMRSVVGYVLLGIALAWSQGAVDCRAADNAPAAKEKSKSKGRLPNYYSKVVDGLQREKINKIQESYDPQIQQLQAQLKTLTGKRDAEINALLTPEQRERVATLMAEAKQKRAAAAAKASAAEAKPAANSTTNTEAAPAK